MYSKATLVGVVGVEPRYKPATNTSESVIYFRIGCKVYNSAKEITEWYTIKAFGRTADYLHQNAKLNSSVFLEASIRSKRWVKDGVERSGFEFHAFTAQVITQSENAYPNLPDTPVSNELPFPEVKTSQPKQAVQQPKEPPKPLTAEEALAVAKRFRQTYEACKKEADRNGVSENSSFDSNDSPVSSVPYVSGNPETDSLLNCRQTLLSKGCKRVTSYSSVRE